MSHLWFTDGEGDWTAFTLADETYALTSWPPLVIESGTTGGANRVGVHLVPSPEAAGSTWAVMSSSSRALSVGGRPVPIGLRALADRDEIRVEGVGTVFFSTETPPRVEPFPPHDRPHFCPRCKLEIVPGTSSVRCPDCGVWHHELPERNCWTYGENCTLCPQPTALDGGFRWKPA